MIIMGCWKPVSQKKNKEKSLKIFTKNPLFLLDCLMKMQNDHGK